VPSVSSSVVSYDPSSNLEFTVTFAYERYITDKTGVIVPSGRDSTGGRQAVKSSAQDNPSSIYTNAKASVEEMTRSEMAAKAPGEYWKNRRAWRKGGKSNMVNQPTITHDSGNQPTTGQNTSKSTQQLRDARDGVGSNTTIAASRSKSG